jgi:hypothetical protein
MALTLPDKAFGFLNAGDFSPRALQKLKKGGRKRLDPFYPYQYGFLAGGRVVIAEGCKNDFDSKDRKFMRAAVYF